MTFFERIKYSSPLAVVIGAIFGLVIALASSDVIGVLPTSSFDLLLSPIYWLAIFIAAFLLAPFVSRHFKITGWEDAPPERKNNFKNHFALRQILIVLIGLIFILLTNLLVYFLNN